MGILARVLSFVRSQVDDAQAPEVSVDLDGDETLTALHFTPPGVDAAPLAGDVATLAPSSGKGAVDAVGYQDPATPGEAQPGEVRLYARSAPGAMAVELWLQADGSLVARNALGELAIDAAGVVTWRTPLGQNGAGTHTHPTPFGPSGAPIPGT